MSDSKIVIATGNPGKFNEIQSLLKNSGLHVIAQSDLSVEEAEETGLSFVENAIIKARNASRQTHLPAIADDSGLEVDVLDGRPGIYSSRYSGEDCDHQRNMEKLLYELTDKTGEQRTANFRCVIVFMRHDADPSPVICEGVWRGRILDRARGHNGFGYDPVFWTPSHNASAAELDPEEKNKISHRALALLKLKEHIEQQVNGLDL